MQEPQETWVQSPGQEDPLEEGMATHSSILPWTEEPGGLQSRGLQKSGTTYQLNHHMLFSRLVCNLIYTILFHTFNKFAYHYIFY